MMSQQRIPQPACWKTLVIVWFLLLWLLGFFSASSQSQPAQQQVERHLIIMGCKSVFWQKMKTDLAERIEFTTQTCIYTEEDEAAATDYVWQRKLQNPDFDIHMVATILTRNHCTDFDACRANNPGDKYLPALQAGVKGWFIESEPHFEALGIVNRTSTQIQLTELFPDNAAGGRQVAREFCRLGASIAPASIVVLYGTPEAAHSAARIDNFIAGLSEFCPDDKHQIKYRFHADWNADKAAALLSPVFLRDGSVDAVVAANDDMAMVR